MFSSNVQPKRRIHAVPKDSWRCPECKRTLRNYWVKCPRDGHPRPK